MSSDLDSKIRNGLAQMVAELGEVDPPGEVPEVTEVTLDRPVTAGSDTRRWPLAVAAVVLTVCGAIGVLATRDRAEDSGLMVATDPDDEKPAAPDSTALQPTVPPTSDTGVQPGTPTTIEAVESAPGRWRPRYPNHSEALLRFAPGAAPRGALPDGPHFGLVHGVVDDSGRRAVVFSRGTWYEGDAAAEALARAMVDAGVGEDGDPMSVRHDWWTPEWGTGIYIEPDFDLPIEIPVDSAVTIVIHSDQPNEVTWPEFMDAAEGLGTLPWFWSGHAFVLVDDGAITHIENMWTP